MSAQTAAGNAVQTACHHAVKRVSGIRNESALLPGDGAVNIELRRGCGVVGRWPPVRNQMISLPERAIETDADAEVQSEVLEDVVVVLEVGLEDLEVDVIFRLGICL